MEISKASTNRGHPESGNPGMGRDPGDPEAKSEDTSPATSADAAQGSDPGEGRIEECDDRSRNADCCADPTDPGERASNRSEGFDWAWGWARMSRLRATGVQGKSAKGEEYPADKGATVAHLTPGIWPLLATA